MNKRIRKKRGLLKPLMAFTCFCGRQLCLRPDNSVGCKCGAWHSWGPFGFTHFDALRIITLDVPGLASPDYVAAKKADFGRGE